MPVESRMRGNAHVRFGGRPGETGQPRSWHRAPGPPNIEKVRAGGRVQRKCVVIAHAVHETGRREIIGLDVGEAETEAFWTEFLRSLVARGLVGVQLAISDAHPGLKAAIARVLGSSWQRCTVHFLRDLRGHWRKDQHDASGALIRQLFTARDGVEARRRLADAITQLEPRLPKIARLLEEAEDDILAFYAFPSEHWPKLRSTNALERFNREIGRRTDVVGVSPDDSSLIRLVSMLKRRSPSSPQREHRTVHLRRDEAPRRTPLPGT
jgi:putative transposase